MMSRVKQVISAIRAAITAEDRQFVATHLTAAEQRLFWRMNLPDQRHALNVAYTALKLCETEQQVNKQLVIKCALLHDVGKVRGDVSTFDKIITVLAHKMAPQWSREWGRPGFGNKLDNLRHAFYIYFHHAERSARMLAAINVDPQIVNIVARHHETPADNQSPELRVLQAADNLN